MFGRMTTLTAALAVLAVPAFAQQAPDGAAAFNRACASCHRDGQTTAPTPAVLRQLTPEGVLNSITQGRMQAQGATLSAGERRAVAEYVAGRALATATTAVPNRCSASPAMTDAATSPGWNGWGNGATNTRFAPGGGLTAADLPRLKLKWAFGYSGVNAARAQPTIAGGRLFVASENGEAHALDPKTGCTYWTFRAQAGIRTGLTVGPYKNASGSGQAVYFGDVRANAYAVDAQTGRELWVRKVDEHPAASLTGAPAVHDGRVFVPVQGLNEEGQGGTGKYRLLHVPRQPGCARREHRRGALEDIYGGPAAAARQERPGHPDVGPGRAAASGRRRPSMPSGTWCTSPPATATPTRRSR